MKPADNSEEVLFREARLRPPGPEREAYLEQACAGNAALRARLAALLQAHESPDPFLEPAVVPPASAITPVPPEEGPGTVIGRYKLLEKLGEGGYGLVYVAEQREPVKRRVALKIIKLGMDTREVVARFESERQALAMMDHPNIARVFDGGATDTGRPFFVMELVRGVRMTDYCDQHHLSTEERLKLFVQVCHAIQHAHQKGIIHRDIKPSNILVMLADDVPVPKVIDFGIAKALGERLTDKTVYTRFEQFIGTPAYTSPEQAGQSGLDVDTRSDIYALGVLLYELLTGRTPFEPKALAQVGLNEILRCIREEEPPKPSTRLSRLEPKEQTTTAQRRATEAPKLIRSLRGDLDWIVMKCLEKDRTRRYDTPNGLAMDIRRHLENEPVIARPPSTAYRIQKAWRRNRTAFAGAALMVAVLVGATGISVWQAVRATRAETLAKQRLAESEAISQFLTEAFQSPDPARDGRTITVAETLGAATKRLETDLADQPARRSKIEATLGRTYHALGLYGEAIALEEKVRGYYLAAFGLEHPDTLTAMSALAGSYEMAGRSDEAFKLREQVLPLRRKVSGPENPSTLWAMQGLAESYDDAGRQDEALKLREQVLALSRKVRGPEHLDTLWAMYYLAKSYNDMGRWDQSLKLSEEELALDRKVIGPEHPNTLWAMLNLAFSYDKMGRRDEAIKLQEEVVALERKVLGPEHHHTIFAMRNLSDFYSHARRRHEAIKLKEEVVALRRKVTGLESIFTLWDMSELASLYDNAGRRDEALKLREEVLTLRRKVSGPEHLDTLWAMQALSDSYQEAGRRDEALKLREELLMLRRKLFGPEHPDTLWAMLHLANSYDAAGRCDEALKLREDLLTLRRKVNGPEHHDTLWAMHHLAHSYDEVGRWDEARKLREEALRLRRQVFGPQHPDTLNALHDVARTLATSDASEIRNGTNAVRLAEEAVAATSRTNAHFLDTLAAAYAETHQFDKAVSTQNEAIALLTNEVEKNDYKSRLKLYQDETPYRQPTNNPAQ